MPRSLTSATGESAAEPVFDRPMERPVSRTSGSWAPPLEQALVSGDLERPPGPVDTGDDGRRHRQLTGTHQRAKAVPGRLRSRPSPSRVLATGGDFSWPPTWSLTWPQAVRRRVVHLGAVGGCPASALMASAGTRHLQIARRHGPGPVLPDRTRPATSPMRVRCDAARVERMITVGSPSLPVPPPLTSPSPPSPVASPGSDGVLFGGGPARRRRPDDASRRRRVGSAGPG